MGRGYISLTAYEDQDPSYCFVSVPNEKGRYVKTDICVILRDCPQCKSFRGEPCTGAGGKYWAGVHIARKDVAKPARHKEREARKMAKTEKTTATIDVGPFKVEELEGLPGLYEQMTSVKIADGDEIRIGWHIGGHAFYVFGKTAEGDDVQYVMPTRQICKALIHLVRPDIKIEE